MNNEEKSRSVHPSIFLYTASGIFASLRLAYWQIILYRKRHLRFATIGTFSSPMPAFFKIYPQKLAVVKYVIYLWKQY